MHLYKNYNNYRDEFCFNLKFKRFKTLINMEATISPTKKAGKEKDYGNYHQSRFSKFCLEIIKM